MLEPDRYEFCSEFYVVAKTLEVVVQLGGEIRRLRLEALHEPRTGRYSHRAYIEEDTTVQPTYPQSGGRFDRKPESIRVWVYYDLPWTDRDSADAALAQALSFLRERC